jgi:hypothetical protein
VEYQEGAVPGPSGSITISYPNNCTLDTTNNVLYFSTGNKTAGNGTGQQIIIKVTDPHDSNKRKYTQYSGVSGSSGSTDSALSSTYNFPFVSGVYNNALYILDQGNTRIRKLDFATNVSSSFFTGRVITDYAGTTTTTLVNKTGGFDHNMQIYVQNPKLTSNPTNIPYQQLNPPYYFGFASLNYIYDTTYKHVGQVGLYLMGTRPNGEVAAYYEFPLANGYDFNTTTGKFTTNLTGFVLGTGNPSMIIPNNYQIILDPKYSTNNNGILYVMELSTGYTMRIIPR